jgi:2-dehydro-3-deoxyphosphogluconate aldolase/(4S)-4-hydroxy-2-oxoglutarate aldolase
MIDIFAALTQQRVMPLLVVDDPADALPLGQALASAGVRLVEVAFRTPASLEICAALCSVPGLCVGAGTVLRQQQVVQAVEAGAQFVVSPGTSAAVLGACQHRGVAAIPGVATATEIQRAVELGATTLKFFPAGQLGGVDTLSALSGPFPQVAFIPTGGVDEQNMARYLAMPNVAAVGGSWVAPRSAVRAHEFAQIAELAARALRAAATEVRSPG